MKAYYDARAPEYDEWYLGLGRFAAWDRPDWDEDLSALVRAIGSWPAARTLDVACGTGFLTAHLPGALTALDHSARMLEIAATRLPRAEVVRGDALDLPFASHSFERVFTAHFYGHLEATDRARFLDEAYRVAPQLIVVDAALRADRGRCEWQERTLNDGSRFAVFKRYFDGRELAAELGGGVVLLENRWFVAVKAERP